MPRRTYIAIKAAILLAALGGAVILRAFPDSRLADTVLPYPVGASLFVLIGAVGLAPATLVALGVVVALLIFIRRRWAFAAVRLYVALHWLIAGLFFVQIAVLFFPALLAATVAVISAGIVGGGLWRRWGVARIVAMLLNGVIAAALLSPVLVKVGEMPVDALASELGAVRYFPPSNAYDVVPGEDDERYVAVGYGGGLFRVRGTDFPESIVAGVTDLAKAKKIAVCRGRIVVTNNAGDDPSVADAVSLAWPDLTGRVDLFFPDHDRIAGVQCDPSSGRLFFVDEKNPRVAIWDLDTAREIPGPVTGPNIHVGETHLDAGGRRLYVTSWFRANGVYEIDLDTLEVTATPDVGASVSDVAVDEKRNRVYVARPLHRRVDVYDRTTWEPVDRLPTVACARIMRLVDDGALLAVGSYMTGELDVFAVDDPSRRVRIRAFPRIRGLTVDAGRDELLVASMRGVWGVPLEEIRRRMDE